MYIGLDIGGTNMVAGHDQWSGKIINKVSRPVNKAWDPAELCRQSAQLAQQAAEVGASPQIRSRQWAWACPVWWTTRRAM